MANAAAAPIEPVPANVPKPKAVEKPPPDPMGPVECSCLVMDRPYGVNQTNQIIRVGSAVATGIEVGGLCERIVLYPNGTFLVHVRRGIGTMKIPEAERLKHAVCYMVFREGHAEVIS